MALSYQWQALNNQVPGAEKSRDIANFNTAGGLLDVFRGSFSQFRADSHNRALILSSVVTGMPIGIGMDPSC